MRHIWAFDPTVQPMRRRVAGLWCRVWPILWTSQQRCGYFPNPKRPTWRCKRPPTLWVERKPDGWGAALCEPCYDELRRKRPV
jgi:hypothetical protein